MNHQDPEDLLTLEELAAMLRVSKFTVYDWRSRNYGPPAIRLRGHLRYRRREVDAWLDAHSDGSPVGAA
jgi:excisionase family DNA binding protein